MEVHDTVWFNVTKDTENFHTARASKSMPCGLSETSRAIREAYKVTRDQPDPRDEEIKPLKAENDFLIAKLKSLPQ